MNMGKNIEEIRQQTYRYFYRDGLVELGVGALFAVIGGFVAIMDLVELGSPLSIGAGIGLPVIVIGGTFLMRWLVETLKERVTYPRTGYVSYRDKPDRGRWIIIFFALGIGVSGLVFDDLLPEWVLRMSIAEGLLLGAVLFYMGYRVSLPRLYLIALVALAAGFGSALAGLGDIPGTTATFVICGLALMISGGAALLSYLSRNPAPTNGEVS